MPPLRITLQGWMITRLLELLPVSLTSMIRTPANCTILYIGVVAVARHRLEDRDDPRVADDRGQLVLHAGADAGVAVELQLAGIVELQLAADVVQVRLRSRRR